MREHFEAVGKATRSEGNETRRAVRAEGEGLHERFDKAENVTRSETEATRHAAEVRWHMSPSPYVF